MSGNKAKKDVKVNGLVFTDDAATLASSKPRLQTLLDDFSTELIKIGLDPNPEKCHVLSLIVQRKRKLFYMQTEPYFKLYGTSIIQAGATEKGNYLEVQFNSTGIVKPSIPL